MRLIHYTKSVGSLATLCASSICFALVLNGSFGGIASGGVIEHLSYADFLTSSGSGTIHEDWASIPNSTIIQDQTIGGITYRYQNAFGKQLHIGGGGGWGMRFGSIYPSGAVTNFGWSDVITFEFSTPIQGFGINFVQGNYSNSGTSIFAVQIDGGQVFYRSVPVVQYGANVGYLGLTRLESASSIKIWQAQSGANVVWGVYSVDYANIPAPAASALLALAGLVSRRRRA